ncbi:MAG: DUF4982 domain-containing protein [Verrucomicrobia bacterium]|nr:MAG: DUF4982 domain-containing protein [Verrucomicrobiota bacterium]
MTLHKALLTCLTLATATLGNARPSDMPSEPPSSHRTKLSLNIGWQFHRGDAPGEPFQPGYDTADWEPVNLPHTYKLASINLDDSEDDMYQLTFHRDVCWYRRTLRIDARPGQRVFLEFEGAKQLTDLWVNGRHVGTHAISGYTPFHFDITDYVRNGADNLIALRLDNRKTDKIPPDGNRFDYVLFGGLYRDVYLVVTDPLRITFPWEAREAGIFITTPSVSAKNATITVRTTVRNEGDAPRDATLVTRIIDAEGTVVARLTETASVKPGCDHTFLQTGGIDEDVHLWSFDDPYLYRVNTQLIADGEVVDMAENPLGLRWFELRPGVGFCLNGQPVELIGANRHQQYPYIGDAVPDNLHWNDAIKFKKAGMNIIRLAHYPHDDAFLDACDALGILVAEEPPTWIEFGPPVWMDRLEESLRRMVRNHRNHPCVWGWGAGINHRGPVKRLHYAAKQEDPTRITMNNGTVWTGPQHRGITDLYAVMDYRGAVRPEGEFLFAMEHSGGVAGTPEVGEENLPDIVARYKADPWRIGLASWAAHDGFSFKKRDPRYPNLSRWTAAAWDAFRIPKPVFYWYKAELRPDEPMVHIPDDRGQEPGSTTVISNCEEVELLLDGKLVDRRGPADPEKAAVLNAPLFRFPVPWDAGNLTARGLIDGKVVATHTRNRPGPAHHIALAFDPDTGPWLADGSSIYIAYARVCDRDGNTIEGDTPLVHFAVDGPAEIVGDASIGANPVTWDHGVAPVLIRAGTTAGTITLTASAEGLQPGTARIETTPATDDVLARRIKPFVEPLRLRVDIGNPQQHVEDEWTAWNGQNPDGESAVFTAFNGASIRASLRAAGAPLEWTNTWGVPGDLSFMIEDSVSVPAGAEIILSLENLPEGRYLLKTWHHILGDRDEATPLDLFVDDAAGRDRSVHRGFQPTYGAKIQVSAAGTGDRGDGGSNLGAGRFAETLLHIGPDGAATLRIRAAGDSGKVNLNGFELHPAPAAP